MEKNITYYILQDYNLESLEIESILEADGKKEITFKRLNTDEGGNKEDLSNGG